MSYDGDIQVEPPTPDPNEHKVIIAWGILWFLVLMGIGGCTALGGGCSIKLSDTQTAAVAK